MAAAALRSAARKVCGRAFERPQTYFTTAASAALKEEQRRLLPRISHGGSSLRRFGSSESSNLKNKQGAKPAATVDDDVLAPDSPLWNMKLSDIPPDSPLWNMKVSVPPWSPAHPRYVHHQLRWVAGMLALCSAVYYVEANYIFKRPIFRDNNCRKNKDGSSFAVPLGQSL